MNSFHYVAIDFTKSSSGLPRDLSASVKPSNIIEAKKVHKAEERSSCSTILMVGELHGCDLAALAYKLKYMKSVTPEKFILWVFWSDIRKYAPTKVSHYTVDQL